MRFFRTHDKLNLDLCACRRVLASTSQKKSQRYYQTETFKEAPEELERVLGPIADRLRTNNILPSHVSQFGYAIVRYDRDGCMNQHKDEETRVDHFVIGISVGEPCKIDFVRDVDGRKASIQLAPKSLYVTEEEAHEVGTHGISSVKEDSRYSLLFYVPSITDTSLKFDMDTKKFKFRRFECSCGQMR